MKQILKNSLPKALFLIVLFSSQNLFSQSDRGTEITHNRFHNFIIGGDNPPGGEESDITVWEDESLTILNDCYTANNGSIIIPFWFIVDPKIFDFKDLNITSYNEDGLVNGSDTEAYYTWLETGDLSTEFQENVALYDKNSKDKTHQVVTNGIQISVPECSSDLEQVSTTVKICFTKDSPDKPNTQVPLTQDEINDVFNLDLMNSIHKDLHGGDTPEIIDLSPCFDIRLNVCCTGDGPQFAPTFDMDGDGIEDFYDNCISEPNPDQNDADGNGIGDACEDFEIWGQQYFDDNKLLTNHAERIANHNNNGSSLTPFIGQFGKSTILNKEYYIYNTDGRLVLKTTSKKDIILGNNPQLYIILEFINGKYSKSEKVILR